ncbi:hypothetical protein Plec18167_003013 [Paecilomyces lecythidis]|uniref:Uncharacterized protein n=1 Tax=Paecilomyces lecythidis TaxID=3004212 RepID=A0ABR3Y3X0_9EURO
MPTSNNTSSPVKRPGLARRSVSSHAIITPRPPSSNNTDLAHSHTQRAPVHKLHRAHVVGGAHRTHARNPSFGKNLNKLQRPTSGQNIIEGHAYGIGAGTGTRHHQRKKSAPATPAAVTPAASPKGQHVRWDAPASFGDHKTQASIKKNFSTPALRRNTTAPLGKKALVTDRPQSAKGQPKKVVGFELGDPDEDDDEGEWEDSTQSPESTRRNSVAPSKGSADNSTVLVDPLTFVKRPYPRLPQATSLPESASKAFSTGLSGLSHSDDEAQDSSEETGDNRRSREQQEAEEEHAQFVKGSEHDIASRLLSQSRPSKAPPAMSSISAMAKPAVINTASRNASLTNLASAHDGSRRSHLSTSNPAMASTPGTHGQATSSSIEGGVSRFIINKDGRHAASRTDSDPNTPSSFLPHYHPQTPPSPGRATSAKKTKASPPSRPPGAEPPSRTQQKLWLQRTAALTTSPPDPHDPTSAISPSTMDPAFMAATHARTSSRAYDGSRVVNGGGRIGGAAHESEAKHVRKVYEKTASELAVVRRFQSPSNDSFKRVRRVMLEMERPSSNPGHLTKSVKSAPALANIGLVQTSPARNQHRRVLSRGNNDSDTGSSSQVSKNKASGSRQSRVYFQDQDDVVNISPSEPVDRLDVDHHHATTQHLSTSDEGVHGRPTSDDLNGGFFPNETELMLRRLWESREVATVG